MRAFDAAGGTVEAEAGGPEADRAWLEARWEFPLARFWTVALWSLVVCVYGYLVVHTAGNQGIDFKDIFSGPDKALNGISPYPTSSHPGAYFAAGEPYFIMPPAAPVLLAPLGLLSRHAAWIAFAVPMVLLVPLGLASILRQLRPALPWLPPLALLAVAVFLPYRKGLELGNLDVLCAGVVLCGISLLLRRSSPATVAGGVLLGVAVALKPTLWPLALVALVAIPLAPRIGLITAAAVPTAIGLLAVPGIDRFFTYVLPELSSGEPEVNAKRQALGDLVRTTPVPDTAITVLSLLATAAVTLALIVICSRRRAEEGDPLWGFAPLGAVIPLALFLAPYGFVPYSIYLLAALPFAVVGGRPWMAVAAGLGVFAIGADVTLDFSHLNGVLQWRFLIGVALLSLVALAGLREWLLDRPVLGFAANSS
jgi:hypothetical protein